MLFFLLYYHCADAVLCECLKDNGMRYPSVYYVCSVDAAQYRIKASFDLRYHSALYDSFIDEILYVVLIENGDDVVSAVFEFSQNSADIGKSDELRSF